MTEKQINIVPTSLSANLDAYEKEKVIFNVVKLNLYSIIFAITVGAIFMTIFLLIWKQSFYTILSLGNIPFYFQIAIFIVLVCLHEVIHAIFFAIFAENKFKSVKLGIMPARKLFTPYCHCKEIITIAQYRIIALMPMFILGILPAVIALVLKNNALLTWGIMFTIAGFGDFLFLVKLRVEKDDDLVYDLPDEAGFVIYRKRTAYDPD